MRLAFVHDWFNVNGGAEKVAADILDVYKHNDITVYTIFDSLSEKDEQDVLKGNKVKKTFLNYIPFRSRIYRYMLPLMPWAISRFNLKGYDLIISSSHAIAKGCRQPKDTLHVCYCHTPMRYVWDMYDEYAGTHTMGASLLYKLLVKYIRNWDLRSSKNVHYYIANSINVQQRIKKNYDRESVVIYPPVRIEQFELNTQPRKDYYLCVGRFVPYKKMDLIIEAFKDMPDKKLVIIGEGYGAKHAHDLLEGSPNIQWLGYVDDAEMIRYIQEAKACIFAAKEDFGILCVEVQACGTPVLALRYGGYLETVAEGSSGYLFDEQTKESIIAVVHKLEQQPLTDHARIRENSLRFSDERFEQEFSEFVTRVSTEFYKKR